MKMQGEKRTILFAKSLTLPTNDIANDRRKMSSTFLGEESIQTSATAFHLADIEKICT